MAIAHPDHVMNKLLTALGLEDVENVKGFTLISYFDGIATVTVEFYPDEDKVDQLEPVLKEYYLMEKQAEEIKVVHTKDGITSI